MTGAEARVINVLLVEDDPGDVLMTREAFDEYLHNRLDVVTDGAAALAYLRQEEPYADVPRPDLILLDLNLPRRDGREVLAEIKDDPGDVLMTQEAFEEHKVRNNLAVVNDGTDAIAYLRREGQYADAPRPDLVLLDLNLPRRDGREVLAEIKNDPNLCDIPVVVLTTSQADEDILRSYKLHANAYVTKPVDFERFIAVVRQIDEFFVSVVKLPPRA